MRFTRVLAGPLAIAILLLAQTVSAQRVQFSTPPQANAGAVTTAPIVTGAPPITASPPALGGAIMQPPAWDPYNPGAGSAQVGQPLLAPPQPIMGQPGVIVPQQPAAVFPGGVPWRPDPGYFAVGNPDGTTAQLRRFLSELRFEHTWLAGPSNATGLQIHTGELSGTFAVPFLYNTTTPLLITPGLAVHLLDGPAVAPDVNGSAALPPRVYDAYLDLGWKPQLTSWLSADVGARASYSSDFRSFNGKSMRWMGRGMGILTFSPNVQLALGVLYLDRVDIKLLPAGGVIWAPSPDTRFDILFPNPKLAKRCRDIGTVEMWYYLAGEYGGGSWNINRPGTGVNGNFDYNDIRVMLGMEWTTQGGLRGHVEAGYVFERELIFDTLPPPRYSLDNTYMLRGGLSF